MYEEGGDGFGIRPDGHDRRPTQEILEGAAAKLKLLGLGKPAAMAEGRHSRSDSFSFPQTAKPPPFEFHPNGQNYNTRRPLIPIHYLKYKTHLPVPAFSSHPTSLSHVESSSIGTKRLSRPAPQWGNVKPAAEPHCDSRFAQIGPKVKKGQDAAAIQAAAEKGSVQDPEAAKKLERFLRYCNAKIAHAATKTRNDNQHPDSRGAPNSAGGRGGSGPSPIHSRSLLDFS